MTEKQQIPEFSEEEIQERVDANEDMVRLVLDNRFLALDEMNRFLKLLKKEQLNGKIPPLLLDVLHEKGYIDESKKKALAIASERLEREREVSHYSIKGYNLTKKIGGGGLGVVYQAWQISMKRRVAIKILYDKWAKDTEFKNRFILEARVMGRLSHQNLIQVYDVGREGGHLYFTMEFIDGPTVEELIRREGKLSLLDALDICVQVARAINYIAGFDIVHRDIKPANIMMTRSNTAKLGDFGFLFSKYESKLAQDGYVIGTPDYISPEQASGREVDHRSDIYSLGVCLYHMITGKVPYNGSVSNIMRQHVFAEIPDRIPEKGPAIPPDIYSLICKMMAKEPEERYNDVKSLLDDLQYLKANEIMKRGIFSPGSTIRAADQPGPRPAGEIFSEKTSKSPALEILKKQNRLLFTLLSISLGGLLLMILVSFLL